MRLPDYEAWALFAAVADHGSFRGAAAAHGLSVPTVSKAIARLERALGLALFHRTSRRVALTAAGEALAVRARAIVASAAAAEEAALDDATALAGPIRLTAPMSLALACVGDLIAGFLAAHPAVTIDLILSDAQCDLVADAIDLGLRIAALADSSLLVQTIVPVPLGLVASPAYLAAAAPLRHPDDLARHRLLGYGHAARGAAITLVGPDGARVTAAPTGPLFANNGDAMRPLLLAGQGVALLPHFIVADALADGRLVRVLPGWTGPALTLSLVSPPSRLRPARVRALGDHLVAGLKHHPALTVAASG